MFLIVRNLIVLVIGIVRPCRLNPFRPLFRACANPKSGSDVRCPIGLRGVCLNATVQKSIVLDSVTDRIGFAIFPIREQSRDGFRFFVRQISDCLP